MQRHVDIILPAFRNLAFCEAVHRGFSQRRQAPSARISSKAAHWSFRASRVAKDDAGSQKYTGSSAAHLNRWWSCLRARAKFGPFNGLPNGSKVPTNALVFPITPLPRLTYDCGAVVSSIRPAAGAVVKRRTSKEFIGRFGRRPSTKSRTISPVTGES